MKAVVWLPFRHEVGYEIEVPKDATPEQIREALRAKDAGDWFQDPAFYECLGGSFDDMIDLAEDDELRLDTAVLRYPKGEVA